MPSIIPFTPGESLQTATITLDGEVYVLRARWNTRDAAWYLDAFERDGTTVIATSIKLVQGVRLGERFRHPLFAAGLVMWDPTDTGDEAGLNDFGTRVFLVHMTADDAVLSATVN